MENNSVKSAEEKISTLGGENPKKPSKANTFIGFAMRAGKYKIGFGAVETLKKANLIVVCRTASENSKKKAVSLKNKLNSRLIITAQKDLSEITHREGAKVMAITDKAIAAAVLQNIGEEFIEG